MSSLRPQENINQLIDTHCHLDFPIFDDDRGALIQQCINDGIEKFIVPGVTALTWQRLSAVAAEFPSISPAYGLHPMFIDEHHLSQIEQLSAFIKTTPCIAIGEIGLDFYIKDTDRKKQSKIFHAQLVLAQQNHLPVILHVRKAHDEVITALKKHKIESGIVHAFNGSLQQAERYLKLGMKLGFGGALTYDRALHLRKLAKELPLDAIVLETDSPDMIPMSYASLANTPMTILKVLNELSMIRQMSNTEISSIVLQNTKQIFPGIFQQEFSEKA